MKFVKIFTLFIIVTILVQFSVDSRKHVNVVVPAKVIVTPHTPGHTHRTGHTHENVAIATHTNTATAAKASLAKGITKLVAAENTNPVVVAAKVKSKGRETESFRGFGGGGMRSSGGFGGGMSGGMRGGYSGVSRGYSGGYGGRGSYNSNYSMGRGRSHYVRPSYGYRYGRGFGSNYWWPWYRNSWIRGVRNYPQTFVRRNSRGCGAICRNLVADCIKFDVNHDEDGSLKCKCKDDNNDEETIFEKWCWTPTKCVKARESGCQAIMKQIKSRFTEEEEKRR